MLCMYADRAVAWPTFRDDWVAETNHEHTFTCNDQTDISTQQEMRNIEYQKLEMHGKA